MESSADTRELEVAPLLVELLALIDEHRPDDRAAVSAFATAYLRRLAPGAKRAAQQLFAEVCGAYDFMVGRADKRLAVRAFNPTLAESGYDAAGSVLETASQDIEFLVDSVREAIATHGLDVVRAVHPVIGVERDRDGNPIEITDPREATRRESLMHFEFEQRLDQNALAALARSVAGVLEDVHAVVADFPAMADRCRRMIALSGGAIAHYSDEEVDDAAAFLRWLLADNFIFLGYREYRIVDDAVSVVPDSGLGILSDEASSAYDEPVPIADLPPHLRAAITSGGQLLTVAKTNGFSPVHRRERMDYVSVRRVGNDGRPTGEARMLGLFTSRALAARASEIPLLDRKLRHLLRHEDLIEGSHDYKAAVALFDSFPKDELLAAGADDIRRAVVRLMALEADAVRLLGRRADDGRAVWLIAALPAARYDVELVERFAALLRERYQTDAIDINTVLGEGDRVRVHFAVRSAGGLPEVSVRELDGQLVSLARTWDDDVRERLEVVGRRALADSWAQRFPEYYRASTDPDLVVGDIESFERLAREGFVVGLQDQRVSTRVALYKSGGKVRLGEAMPILEQLGLRVVEEVPTRLLGGDGDTWVQAFGVLGPDGAALDLAAVGQRLADCITAVWRGESESDSLNRLVLLAGLDWRQVGILRAYRMYRQRIGSRFTQDYQNDVLAANPELTALLMRYFELRLDPAHERDEAAERALREEFLAGLDAVSSLDDDRILRNQLGVIDATLRTNAFDPERSVTAFKVRSADVPAIPQPAPLVEIYVYSTEMEGIHLRGGAVARGGIRWSDRMDYRTEVYGLMRAQLTKNAVIVPAGAKGGFYLKAAPSDPGLLREEVKRQYVRYIGGLLDLTDNLVDGEVVFPERMRILDSADTYLVVAADKGTATFSDTANDVAMERGFWLGDAFASGGSSGYDHKALGITARGTWESVRRHFSQLGVDVATDRFTVVGIGDMSGDVFGNGMLLSDQIRLIAAYDHRHIFIDPDPDPALGFDERRRLFELPGSSWDDYDRTKISAGGGVWPRTSKSIALPEQARAALGITDATIDPDALIRAVLCAPVDLLFNGGIGTVVKASTESHEAAQDRASDSIRVDARDLRARVIGEGGNLGFTRLARVEFARGGGLNFADFIDNSAGVDCSDHEVNLKILLGLAERRGELERPARDELLREVSNDVTDHVLYDSFLQAQILSQEVVTSHTRLDAYEDLMGELEARKLLDRDAEQLPGADEIADRRRAGKGLERPELALLLAHCKLALTKDLLEDHDFCDEPWLERDLRDYFPDRVIERFGSLLGAHPLRRELIATINANNIANSLGTTFVAQLQAETGASTAEIVRAFLVACEVCGADQRWDAIEALPLSVDRKLAAALMAGVDNLVEASTRWYLRHGVAPSIGERIEQDAPLFARLASAQDGPGEEGWRAERRREAQELVDAGIPEQLAWPHVLEPFLTYGTGLIAVAGSCSRDIDLAAIAIRAVLAELELGWLPKALDALPQTRRTERWAAKAIREDVNEALLEIARSALSQYPDEPDGALAVSEFLNTRAAKVARLETATASLAADATADFPTLMLALRRLRAIA